MRVKEVLRIFLPFGFAQYLYWFVWFIPEAHGASLQAALLKCGPILTLVSYSFARDDPKRKGDALFVSRITLGLLASAVGDICLVYEEEGFFIPGMLAFAVAHLFYISAFGFDPPLKPWWLVLLLAPAGLLIQTILPTLMEEDPILPVAVPVYAMLLLMTAWRGAAAAASTRSRAADKFGAVGGLLFLVSDGLLSLWKFGGHLSLSSPPLDKLVGQTGVMATYYSAQFCIALTMLDRFPQEDKRDGHDKSVAKSSKNANAINDQTRRKVRNHQKLRKSVKRP